MQTRLDYIFKALEDAEVGGTTAVKLFDGIVTRTTLFHWKQGKCLPRTDFSIRVIYAYAQLIRRAIDKGLLPVRGKMSHADKYQMIRNAMRAMKDVKQ